MFEIVYDDDGRRRTDGRRLDGYTISSPCEPNGSGELNMCVSCYISKKIRVGRSLLIFFLLLFFFIFPDFTKKHNRCVACTKYITKRGLFLGLFTYNTECMSYCKGIS